MFVVVVIDIERGRESDSACDQIAAGGRGSGISYPFPRVSIHDPSTE